MQSAQMQRLLWREAPMPKARVVYKGKISFGDNDSCPACGKKPCKNHVCRKCNETGCGYCMGPRCSSCGSYDVHNLRFSDVK